MTEFVLVTLYAPLASWGDIAVGESRGSWDRPSRSAVLGLVAAALGIERDQQEAHDALDAGYGVAVRLDAPGMPLVDYHTAQTVAASVVKRRRPATREALLGAVSPGDRETILSRRTYRRDALATAALWTRAEPPRWSLNEIADALRRPRFVLYAGRKANAFGLPLGPRVVDDAATLAGAFTQYTARRGRVAAAPAMAHAAVESVLGRLRPRGGWGSEVSCDPLGAGITPGFDTHRRETRRDTSPHRMRWQFAERIVDVGHLEPATLATPAPEETDT